MHVSSLFCLLKCCLLVYGSGTAEAADRFPARVEIDLVFPRNETYAPAALFPIVFAVQNPTLAATLEAAFDWSLWMTDNFSDTAHTDSGGPYQVKNRSQSDPLFYYEYMPTVNIEANWAVSWQVNSVNCSNSSTGEGIINTGGFHTKVVRFRTAKGAQLPDIAAATQDASCSKAVEGSSRTFNITELLDIRNRYIGFPNYFQGHDTCPVISPAEPSPPPSPCAVKIDPTLAANISASLTAIECSAAHPVVSCPPAKTNAALETRQLSATQVVLLATTFGCLTIFLT